MWRILTKEEVQTGGENIHETHLVFNCLNQTHKPKPFPHCTTALVHRTDKNWTYIYLDSSLLPNCSTLYMFSHPCGGGNIHRLVQFENVIAKLDHAEHFEYYIGKGNVRFFTVDEYEEMIQHIFTYQRNLDKWREMMQGILMQIQMSPPSSLLPNGGIEYEEAHTSFNEAYISFF